MNTAADKFLAWAKSTGEAVIGRRDALQRGPLRNASELDEAMVELSATGLVVQEVDGQRKLIRLATPDVASGRFHDLRTQRTALAAELDRLRTQRERCLMMAGNSDANDRLAAARTSLENHFARKSAGEQVPDDAIEQATATLTDATAAANIAAVASAGARAAATQFEHQAEQVQRQLAQLDHQARAYFRGVLSDKVAESTANFGSAIQAFIQQYTSHHGRIQAVADLAKQHGIDVPGAVPVPRAQWLAITQSKPPFDLEMNLAKPIATESQRITAELSALLP